MANRVSPPQASQPQVPNSTQLNLMGATQSSLPKDPQTTLNEIDAIVRDFEQQEETFLQGKFLPESMLSPHLLQHIEKTHSSLQLGAFKEALTREKSEFVGALDKIKKTGKSIKNQLNMDRTCRFDSAKNLVLTGMCATWENGQQELCDAVNNAFGNYQNAVRGYHTFITRMVARQESPENVGFGSVPSPQDQEVEGGTLPSHCEAYGPSAGPSGSSLSGGVLSSDRLQERAEVEFDRAAFQGQLDALKTTIQEKDQTIQNLQENIDQLTQEVSTQKALLHAAQNQIEALKSENKGLLDRELVLKIQMSEKAGTQEALLQVAQQQIKMLEGKNKGLLEEAILTQRKMSKEISTQKALLQAAQNQIEALKSKNEGLLEEVALGRDQISDYITQLGNVPYEAHVVIRTPSSSRVVQGKQALSDASKAADKAPPKATEEARLAPQQQTASLTIFQWFKVFCAGLFSFGYFGWQLHQHYTKHNSAESL